MLLKIRAFQNHKCDSRGFLVTEGVFIKSADNGNVVCFPAEWSPQAWLSCQMVAYNANPDGHRHVGIHVWTACTQYANVFFTFDCQSGRRFAVAAAACLAHQ